MQSSDWKRADLHMHTAFSGWRSLRLIDPQDCYVSPERAYETAIERGMDYVCFTDHNTIDGALDLLARRPDAEPRLIVGEEVETTLPGTEQWIHINVYGVDERLHDDLQRMRPDCFQLIEELTRRDLFFVLNHPFQSFRSARAARRDLSSLLPLFPGIEVLNSTSPRSHEPILRALSRRTGTRLPSCVGGSDAHTLSRIGAVFTEAPGDDRTEYLRHVRRGTARIGGEALGIAALVRDVYSIVFRYYRDLYGAEYPLPTPRRLKNIFWSGVMFPGVLVGVPAIVPALHAIRQEWIAFAGRWDRVGEHWRLEQSSEPSAPAP